MPSPAKLLASASGVTPDPYFRNVTLLLHGDGSNGAQNNTFLDSSSNNFTITRNGNTTQGSFSPYGTRWSNYFNGSSYHTSPSSTAFAFGTGDYTIECWVYPISTQGNMRLWEFSDNADNADINIGSTGSLNYYNGSAVHTSSGGLIPANAWTHIAIVRSSGTVRGYVNGTQVLSQSSTPNTTSARTISVAGYVDDYLFEGYIADFRVVKGTAVYTSNFTPTTAPLTAITNTSLLTCQSNRFRDASTNNFAITRNGDVRVSPFSPYAPTAPYSAAANGGSMYFDGSGDYLSLPTAAGVIGTGDFTVEAWFKSNVSTAPTHCPIIANYEANSNGSWAVKASAGSNQCLSFAYYNSGWNDLNTSLNISSDLAWHHVAVTRSGTTLRIYADGVLINSWTVTASLGGNGYTLQIGRIANDDAYINGFISDARLAVGTALYTGSTYTVPTAPLTAISGTKFLVGGRNAAIFDSAADNDLETVGNAQISTSVKKFGTGSMSFDGTGDYLRLPPNEMLDVSSGNFTVEAWVYKASNGNYQAIYSNWDDATSGGVLFCMNGLTPALLWRPYDVANALATGPSITANTWTHVAAVRNSNTFTIYTNGVAGTPVSYSTNATAVSQYFVGAYAGGASGNFNGYIDDLRITKGVARYTANFTPPAAPFPDQ